MNCGVRCRHGSDTALLRLGGSLAAVAPIQPLAWELQYAMDAALKSKEKKKNKIMLFAMTWMELETLILCEVNQQEKDKYHMISLVSGI